MSKNYTLSAEYYDVIYDFKDYQKESKRVIQFIEKYKKNSGKELLEVR